MKNDSTLSRRHLLAGVPAVAAVGVPSVATPLGGLAEGSDPIFEAIADYEEALAARLANKDEDLDTDLMDDEFGALEYVFHTTPTTIGGAAALVELWAKMPYGQDIGDECEECVLEMAFSGWKRPFGIRAIANLAAALRQIAAAA
jgi:hypothetical protein